MIKRALISVSNNEGIVDFAKKLSRLGIEILSTSGTAKKLKDAGIKVRDVSQYTGFPEIMEGRVKTLHPKIHGGILALRSKKEHLKQAKKYGIELIDIVVVNLYPFEATVKKNAKFKEVIENIDIGGHSIIRAAAKNFESVAIVVDPKDYNRVLNEIKENKKIRKETLRNLAVKAYKHTAHYDSIIGEYLCECKEKGRLPETLNLTFEKIKDLRYGENPHQKGALYKEPFQKESSIINAKVLMEGKELSFNNYLDADAGLELVKEFKEPTVVVIKHCNPCGVASRKIVEEAFKDAYSVDTMSAFGCVIAMNRACTLKVAEQTKGKYIEVLIAPKFEKDALDFIKVNKQQIRILETGPITKCNDGLTIKQVTSGLLVQTGEWPDIETSEIATRDLRALARSKRAISEVLKNTPRPLGRGVFDKIKLKVVTKRKPTKEEIEDLKFAWKVNKHTKSNSVVFCKNKTAYGLGVGQMSRVDASMIAKIKSAGRAEGGVMSSDAFFPFRDAVDEAVKAGIKAVIQPGGSIRDKEVIEAADEHGMAMVFTGVRLFKH